MTFDVEPFVLLARDERLVVPRGHCEERFVGPCGKSFLTSGSEYPGMFCQHVPGEDRLRLVFHPGHPSAVAVFAAECPHLEVDHAWIPLSFGSVRREVADAGGLPKRP